MRAQLVYNWTRYPTVQADVHSFRTVEELRKLLTRVQTLIARGSGLSYGDASLCKNIVSTLHFNKMLHFDKENGIFRCESGVTLAEVLQVIVPAGWFLPVTPGTKFVTVGGAVAADVHGKNHHKDGSFSHYIREMSLMVSSGEIKICNAYKNADVFTATCGGMGLTGVILEVELQLRKIETAYITQRNIVARNLTELLTALVTHQQATYSVAWIDCLVRGKHAGRGILMLGEHASKEELPRSTVRPLQVHHKPTVSIPFPLPSFLLNRATASIFNALFFLKNKAGRRHFVIHYDQFFYPLDFIVNWNRLYGHRGFLQYQFVVPLAKGPEAIEKVTRMISESGTASFLAVLKSLGPGTHPLSFAMPGYTLALDFPITPKLFLLLDTLDSVVAEYHGKIYLAKDARMKMDIFQKCYPASQSVKGKFGVSGELVKFESLLSQRLLV